MTRNEEIIKLRKSGMTYREIGKKYNLTSVRVHQLCKKAEWKTEIGQKYPWFPFEGKIDTRIFGVIRRKYGFVTEQQFLEMDANEIAKRVPGFGTGAAERMQEIQEKLKTEAKK